MPAEIHIKKCEACSQETEQANSCTYTHIVFGGKEYDRVKFGEAEALYPGRKTYEAQEVCIGCNVQKGGYHHAFCMFELAPEGIRKFNTCVYAITASGYGEYTR